MVTKYQTDRYFCLFFMVAGTSQLFRTTEMRSIGALRLLSAANMVELG